MITVTPEQAPAVIRFCDAVFRACPWLAPPPRTKRYSKLEKAIDQGKQMAAEKGYSEREMENLNRVFDKARKQDHEP